MTEPDIGRLIDRIGPLNNRIRDSEGYRKVALMWELGDVLREQGVKRVHRVAWEVQRKSYITRDLLSYCFRIRRHWASKKELERELGRLRSFSAFRHALPLLENPKYALDALGRRELLSWVLELEPKEAIDRITELKATRIGISNDRTRRLGDVKEAAASFSSDFKLLRAMVARDTDDLARFRRDVGDAGLLAASQLCVAITDPKFKAPMDLDVAAWPVPLRSFAATVLKVGTSGPLVKRRFCRVVTNEQVLEVADLLNSIRSDTSLALYRQRAGNHLRI